MALAFVNSGTSADYSGTPDATLSAIATSLTTGNLIVAVCRFYRPTDDTTVTSVTDTASNTYTQAVGQYFPATDGSRNELWYCANATGHASNVVTFNLSGAAAFWGVVTAQYSGAALASVLDTTATGTENGSSATITSGSFTTTQADEVLIATADHSGAVDTTWTAGTGYTIRGQDPQNVLALEDKIVSAIQSGVTASMVLSTAARNKNMLVATFKAPSIGNPWNYYAQQQ